MGVGLPGLELIKETKGGIVIYRPKGHLNSNNAWEFEKKLLQEIANKQIKMVVDFQHLDYISSAGIRVILKVTKTIKRKDGRIMLCCMHNYVKEVFEISGVGSLLPIAATFDEALEAF